MTQRRDSLVRLVAGLVGLQNADSCVSRVFKSLILRAIKLCNYPDKARKRQKRLKIVAEKKVDAVVVNEKDSQSPTIFVYFGLPVYHFCSIFTTKHPTKC